MHSFLHADAGFNQALRDDDSRHIILLEQFVDLGSAKAAILSLRNNIIVEVLGFIFWVRINWESSILLTK